MAVVRNIAHFDLDSFFVGVELLKDPSLKGKPIAVGGSSERGVVASCSYEARRFGVRSAMPVKLAKRLCPELIMVKGDFSSYSKYSRLVTDIIAAEVPLFEKSSIDEFYIDLTGMDKFFGCSKFTSALRKKIELESGLDISYGLSSNKLVSKIATNEAKPHGQIEIPHGYEKNFLAPLPVDKMPMIGAKTTTLLRSMGIETLSALSAMPHEKLTNLLGKSGLYLWQRANGIDDSPVSSYHEQKSISTENTFIADTADIQFLHAELVRMTGKVAFELRSGRKLTGCIAVKIRYSDFETVSMQCTISYTASDHILQEKARELFDKLYKPSLEVRLIGLRLSHLIAGSYQTDLFEDTGEMIKLYQAIDSIKQSYGEKFLIRASGQQKKNESEEVLSRQRLLKEDRKGPGDESGPIFPGQ